MPKWSVGRAGIVAAIRIQTSGVTLAGFTVRDCVPLPDPTYWTTHPIGSSCVMVESGSDNVTLRDLMLRDSNGTNSQGLAIGCAGITATDVKYLLVERCEITNMDYGVFLHGVRTEFCEILDNYIHGLQTIVRHTAGGDDDFGAVGVGFNSMHASGGSIARSNTITDCSGLSQDYDTDGGGFELWDSSHITMSHNTLMNNENIFETGTWSGGQDCTDNIFNNNICYGKATGSTLPQSIGMIIRSAVNMQVTNNSLTGIDWWCADIGSVDNFSGSTTGLTITDNIFSQNWDKIYAIHADPAAMNWTIDRNQLKTLSGVIGTDRFDTQYTSLANWRAATGLDANSSMLP